MIRWRRFLPWVLTLAVIWVLLNGEPTVANVLAGLAMGTLVMVAFPLADPPSSHHLHPWGALRFVAFVGWSLVTSSAQVVVTSLFPTPARLRSGIVRVELPGASPLVTTLVANAITLTPGTLTITAHAGDEPTGDEPTGETTQQNGPTPRRQPRRTSRATRSSSRRSPDPAVLYVHALGLGDLDEFRADIHDLQRRATAAITPVPREEEVTP